MKAGAFVENYRGMLNFENTPYQNIYGYFTGSVKSQFNNWYLEVPLAARYAINAKWNALAGISYSQAIARLQLHRSMSQMLHLKPPIRFENMI